MLSGTIHFFDRWILKALKVLCAATFAAVVFSVILGILFRYVLKSPLSWVEEFSRLNFVWTTFMGACIATREREHLKIKIFSHRLHPKGTAIHNILISSLGIFFLAVVLWQGGLVYEAMAVQMYAGMPFSQKWQAMPILLGSALMALYFLGILVGSVNSLLKGERQA